MTEILCTRCQSKIEPQDLFCKKCGKKVGKSKILLPSLIALALAGIVSFAGVQLKTKIIGKKPTKQVQKINQNLLKIQEEFQAQSTNPNKLKELRDNLKKILEQDKSDEVTFTLISILNQILKLDANDKQSILDLAELSFERKIFDQSTLYYKRYLDLDSEDLLVRGRYASSLSFEEKYPEALKELEMVLKQDPNNFHALAFSAITYFQIADNKKALEFGDKAIKYAPNQEAKDRLNAFLKNASGSGDPLLDYLKNNPITSNKFVSMEEQGDSLILRFKDFPMEAMPQIAKDKFTGKLKELSSNKINLKTIKIIDSNSGNTIYSITLK